LVREGEDFFVSHRDGGRVKVQVASRPSWYDHRTTSGKRMDRVGTLGNIGRLPPPCASIEKTLVNCTVRSG
jgi:hypothetical protein